MLSSRSGNSKPRKRSGKKSNRPYKPKVDYTDDGFIVTTLYVKPIGNEITSDHLRNYFTKYGKLQNVRIHRKAKGFGFVTFARPEAASKALLTRLHTINGRTVNVCKADSWHQEKPLEQSNNLKAKLEAPPIELTNATGTYLLDLNDDCLYEIFSSLSIMDLCSVAETCTRLKAIAIRIFTKAHKSCSLTEMPLKTIHEIRRMLKIFGSSITDLTIGPSFQFEQLNDGLSARVLDLIIRFCKSIESLRLIDYDITDHYLVVKLRSLFSKLNLLHISDGCIEGDKQLFSNCGSLVELKVSNWDNDENSVIFENKFPKLERFKYRKCYDEDCDDMELESFVSHHKGLKVFSMSSFDADSSSLLHAIASNCLDLEKLSITGRNREKPYGYVNALKSLLALKNLTKLKIKCDNEIVTKFLQELPQLSALESLELWYAQSDAGFIPALSQLKNLKVLKLRGCNHLKNVNSLASLEKLTELSILLPSYDTVVDIDVDIVGLVKRLTDLKKLVIGLHSFVLNRRTYLQLVDVVRKRQGRYPASLDVTAFDIEDEAIDCQLDSKNKDFVKLGLDLDDSEDDSDPSYMSDDYFDDEVSDDDFGFPGDFLFPYMHQQLLHHFAGIAMNEDTDDDEDEDYIDEDTEVW